MIPEALHLAKICKMLIDTHSHIYSEEFNGEIDVVIQHAITNGVEKILLPNIDSSSIKQMLDLSSSYPQVCYPMIGIHPTSVNDDFEEELEVMEYWINNHKFYAIGEIGIDLYWDQTYLEEQVYVFKRQLKMAKKLNLPVSIHLRESYDEVVQVIKSDEFKELKGVFHSFTGTAEQAKEVIDLGFKIGVNGIVTFKNSGIDKMIEQLKISDLVLESDSPYLAPTPFRGKRNESGHLIHIAKKIADIFELSEEEVARLTTQTALEIFDI